MRDSIGEQLEFGYKLVIFLLCAAAFTWLVNQISAWIGTGETATIWYSMVVLFFTRLGIDAIDEWLIPRYICHTCLNGKRKMNKIEYQRSNGVHDTCSLESGVSPNAENGGTGERSIQ